MEESATQRRTRRQRRSSTVFQLLHVALLLLLTAAATPAIAPSSPSPITHNQYFKIPNAYGPSQAVWNPKSELIMVVLKSVNKIAKWTLTATTNQFVVDVGLGTATSVDGNAGSARFNEPSGITALVDSDGTVTADYLISDFGGGCIRKLGMGGKLPVTTACGKCDTRASADGGCDSTTGPSRFHGPRGLDCAHSEKYHVVADAEANRIRGVFYSGTVLTSSNLVGDGTAGENNGVLSSGRVDTPQAVAVWPRNGSMVALFVSEFKYGRLRRILYPLPAGGSASGARIDTIFTHGTVSAEGRGIAINDEHLTGISHMIFYNSGSGVLKFRLNEQIVMNPDAVPEYDTVGQTACLSSGSDTVWPFFLPNGTLGATRNSSSTTSTDYDIIVAPRRKCFGGTRTATKTITPGKTHTNTRTRARTLTLTATRAKTLTATGTKPRTLTVTRTQLPTESRTFSNTTNTTTTTTTTTTSTTSSTSATNTSTTEVPTTTTNTTSTTTTSSSAPTTTSSSTSASAATDNTNNTTTSSSATSTTSTSSSTSSTTPATETTTSATDTNATTPTLSSSSSSAGSTSTTTSTGESSVTTSSSSPSPSSSAPATSSSLPSSSSSTTAVSSTSSPPGLATTTTSTSSSTTTTTSSSTTTSSTTTSTTLPPTTQTTLEPLAPLSIVTSGDNDPAAAAAATTRRNPNQRDVVFRSDPSRYYSLTVLPSSKQGWSFSIQVQGREYLLSLPSVGELDPVFAVDSDNDASSSSVCAVHLDVSADDDGTTTTIFGSSVAARQLNQTSSSTLEFLKGWRVSDVLNQSLRIVTPAVPAPLLLSMFGPHALSDLPADETKTWRPRTLPLAIHVDNSCFDRHTVFFADPSSGARRTIMLLLVAPPRKPVDAAAAAEITNEVAAVGGLAVGSLLASGTMATQASRSRFLLNLVECVPPEQEPPPRVEHITQVSIGKGWVGPYTGGALMTPLLLGAIFFAFFALSAVVSTINGTTHRHALALFRAPGILFIPTVFYVEMVAKHSTVGMAFGEGAQVFVSLVGMVLCVAYVAWIVWRFKYNNRSQLFLRADLRKMQQDREAVVIAELSEAEQDQLQRDLMELRRENSPPSSFKDAKIINDDDDDDNDDSTIRKLLEDDDDVNNNTSASRRKQSPSRMLTSVSLADDDDDDDHNHDSNGATDDKSNPPTSWQKFKDWFTGDKYKWANKPRKTVFESLVQGDIDTALLLDTEDLIELELGESSPSPQPKKDDGNDNDDDNDETAERKEKTCGEKLKRLPAVFAKILTYEGDEYDYVEFTHRFYYFFAEYNDNAPWFASVELAISIAMGVLEGCRVNRTACAVSGILYLVILLLYFVAVGVIKPFLSGGNLLFALGVALLQLLAGIAFVIAHFGKVPELFEASMSLSAASNSLVLARVVIDLLILAYRAINFTASLRKKRLERAGREAIADAVRESKLAKERNQKFNPALGTGDIELSAVVAVPAPHDDGKKTDVASSVGGEDTQQQLLTQDDIISCLHPSEFENLHGDDGSGGGSAWDANASSSSSFSPTQRRRRGLSTAEVSSVLSNLGFGGGGGGGGGDSQGASDGHEWIGKLRQQIKNQAEVERSEVDLLPAEQRGVDPRRGFSLTPTASPSSSPTAAAASAKAKAKQSEKNKHKDATDEAAEKFFAEAAALGTPPPAAAPVGDAGGSSSFFSSAGPSTPTKYQQEEADDDPILQALLNADSKSKAQKILEERLKKQVKK